MQMTRKGSPFRVLSKGKPLPWIYADETRIGEKNRTLPLMTPMSTDLKVWELTAKSQWLRAERRPHCFRSTIFRTSAARIFLIWLRA
jgi:hypothetical protein